MGGGRLSHLFWLVLGLRLLNNRESEGLELLPLAPEFVDLAEVGSERIPEGTSLLMPNNFDLRLNPVRLGAAELALSLFSLVTIASSGTKEIDEMPVRLVEEETVVSKEFCRAIGVSHS